MRSEDETFMSKTVIVGAIPGRNSYKVQNSRQTEYRIEQHWDDMMRIAGSLKLETVQASELIRTLLKSERQSSLAQAIIEAGRINKTLLKQSLA
jgi:TnpA family transposase